MGIGGNYVLVWFGLYICPTKPKPVYRGLCKRRSVLPYYFLLTRHCLFGDGNSSIFNSSAMV